MHALRAVPPFSNEEVWADLMAGNERFRTGRVQPRDLVRERQWVAQAPRPKVIVFTCGDSRVSPEIVFDQKLGELFVIRNAGCTPEPVGIGSMEFAVENFGSCVLVVLGHQRCGAVQAACSSAKVSSPNLKAVVKWIRAAYRELAPEITGGDLTPVEKKTVLISAQAILDRSPDLQARVRDGNLLVVPAYYRLDGGEVERLA